MGGGCRGNVVGWEEADEALKKDPRTGYEGLRELRVESAADQ